MQLEFETIKKKYKGKFDLVIAYHIVEIEKYLLWQKNKGLINKLFCKWGISIHLKKIKNHELLQGKPKNERIGSC